MSSIPDLPGRSLADRIEAATTAIKIKDLAEVLKCSSSNLYSRARTGRMGKGVVLRFGGTIRLDPLGTAEWLRQQGLDK
jgi:hypothetical protein